MNSGINTLYFLSAAAALLWIAAIIRRTYRLARYFQLEGYEVMRYLRWFGRTRRERRGMALALAAILVLFIALIIGGSSNGAIQGQVSSFAYFFGAVNIVCALVLLVIQPRDQQVKQPFVRTPRATRLLAATFIAGAALPVYYHVIQALNLSSGARIESGSLIFFGAMSGVIPMAFAVLLLPIGNGLTWPYEERIRRYYMRLAKARLKRSGGTVICITGSYGKTSTKHYLQHILSARYRTMMTPKSFNTLMGISRVINDKLADDMTADSLDYFIAEADAYFVGENASIGRLVEPKIGMVMTVGPMHLERLGSMENIIKAQYEIIEALPSDGVGVFNGDDPHVLEMFKRGYPQTRLMVTQKGVPGARLEARNIRMEADGLHFDVFDTEVKEAVPFYSPLYGETNITNILMAAAVALHIGLSLETIAKQAESLQPADHRLVRRVLPDGTVIIDDAYSANPVGTSAALGVLALHKQSAHRIVISSGMFELGTAADAENQQLGRHIAQAATDAILIGPKQTEAVKTGLLAGGFPVNHLYVVENLEQAIDIYRGILVPGDTLLMLTDLPDTYTA